MWMPRVAAEQHAQRRTATRASDDDLDAARLRGEAWRAGGLREYARRVGRTASADAVGDGEIGVSRMCAGIHSR